MTKAERRYFTWINLFVSFIGVVYFIYKYFFEIQTQYGIRPHPQTSTWLYAHVASVPLLVFAVGYLYKAHIYPKLKKAKPARSISGLFLIMLFIVMSVSGYLLQLGVSSQLITQAGWVHSIISFLWIFLYLWHFRLRF